MTDLNGISGGRRAAPCATSRPHRRHSRSFAAARSTKITGTGHAPPIRSGQGNGRAGGEAGALRVQGRQRQRGRELLLPELRQPALQDLVRLSGFHVLSCCHPRRPKPVSPATRGVGTKSAAMGLSRSRRCRRKAEQRPVAPSLLKSFSTSREQQTDGKIKATVSLRAVGGRKCLFAHCFEWHCTGTLQNAPVPLQRKRRLKSISRAPPIAAIAVCRAF